MDKKTCANCANIRYCVAAGQTLCDAFNCVHCDVCDSVCLFHVPMFKEGYNVRERNQ